MLELLVVIAFFGLMIKGVRLAFRLAWGAAKLVASILMVLALPLLLVCFLFVGGLALLIPVGVIALAVGILKTCV